MDNVQTQTLAIKGNDDAVAYINAWIDKYEYSPHKATVEELIEHFRGKEE